MEPWLTEYLESVRDSGFQNDTLTLPNRNIRKIDWIPENKYSINLSFNQLEYLPALHSHIGYLSLKQNALTRLPLLPRKLMYLDVEGNPLLELPDFPKTLRVLRASYCHLTGLPEIPSKMEAIYAGFNDLKQLPELPDTLDTLDIQKNDIYELPYLPENLRILRFEDNPCLKKYEGKSLNQIRELVKRQIAKQRCHRFKEELMMVTWHPRRVEKWLHLGFDMGDL